MSRRRSNRVTNSKFVTSPGRVTIIDDCEEDEYLHHRSCWKHIAVLNKRVSKPKRAKELEILKLTAPCFYDECTRRGRSKRRIKCKYLASKLRKKLNSKAFVAYLEDVCRSFSDEKKNSFVYLDCLWFSMYKSENQNIRSSVFDSIKTKQIFSKKYVFLPIVYWSHWTLLIFCNFGEDLDSDNTCMLFLDSLQTTDSSQRLEPDIRKFVLDMYRTEGRTEDQRLVDEIPLHVPVVPQQTNDVECGSFVLYYIQRFIEDAPEKFSVDDMPYFMKEDWFSHKDLEEFCDKLDSLGTIH
ncbi:PREDICTED: probable ubiquitin-like-specific protease 2A isoform X1 [Camelina sativa]|uniref:Probable ubiquitin-like-specific protease 2A isoform X1 n=1 Tax=Camelina sativa TaxID=90675 RepID=A0ABM0ZFV9_CAMSA|nr:PREDICTED: probable ubiquitin-like-specific protease 2A isoform X1 [Camelina sativa]